MVDFARPNTKGEGNAMFFRNENTEPLTAAETAALRRAMADFETQPEVRFDTGTRLLAPILNTLTEARRKFYLVHLPRGGGWVIRRHRPTGEHHARSAAHPHSRDADPADGGSVPVGQEPHPVALDAEAGPGGASEALLDASAPVELAAEHAGGLHPRDLRGD
jgi:hypothetical protein